MAIQGLHRRVEVTLILDDGESVVKRTFHATERVMINGTYKEPGLAVKGIDFEIGFSAQFDADKNSVYTEEVLTSERKEKVE